MGCCHVGFSVVLSFFFGIKGCVGMGFDVPKQQKKVPMVAVYCQVNVGTRVRRHNVDLMVISETQKEDLHGTKQRIEGING